LNPTAENIDKEEISWSLSWQREGHSDRFTRESILASAPPTSGVYGLFNNDCQVFIGESANIQEALLRHESETDFQSRHLQPTGFTFEPCAEELRESKVNELIARFCPVLQTDAALTETWSLSDGPTASWVPLGGQQGETNADHQEFPVHERDKRPKIRRPFSFNGKQRIAFAVLIVVSAMVSFYLGIPTGDNIHEGVNGTGEKPLARISVTQPTASDQAGTKLRPQNNSSIETARGLAKKRTEPAKPGVHATGSTPNGALSTTATRVSATNGSGDQALATSAKSKPTGHFAESANLSKKWSVQISAAPAKDIADSLVQRLKAKGYDGYVVQANVNGQTYYRVRVGHFDGRQEAESVRQSLAGQEGYQDAFLAGD
jgi:cell division septation protein DedD